MTQTRTHTMTLSRVSPEEAARLLREGYVYLDVRSPQEFALGHPQGAFNIPWLEPDPALPRTPNRLFLPVVCRTFDTTQRIVVGCQSGLRSVAAAQALISGGFVHIVEQRAGFAGRSDAFGGLVEAGWQRCGLPVSYQPQAGRDYDALCCGGASDNKPESER
jgi:rhodanese-related sulfurtransferase